MSASNTSNLTATQATLYEAARRLVGHELAQSSVPRGALEEAARKFVESEAPKTPANELWDALDKPVTESLFGGGVPMMWGEMLTTVRYLRAARAAIQADASKAIELHRAELADAFTSRDRWMDRADKAEAEIRMRDLANKSGNPRMAGELAEALGKTDHRWARDLEHVKMLRLRVEKADDELAQANARTAMYVEHHRASEATAKMWRERVESAKGRLLNVQDQLSGADNDLGYVRQALDGEK